MVLCICDHLWETKHLYAFCILRNTNSTYLMHCTSLVVQYSHMHLVSCINSAVIYVRSYHFIAISTSYLNAAGFSDSFLCSLILRIGSIRGGRAEGGWDEAGLGGKLKAVKTTIYTQSTVLSLQYLT